MDDEIGQEIAPTTPRQGGTSETDAFDVAGDTAEAHRTPDYSEPEREPSDRLDDRHKSIYDQSEVTPAGRSFYEPDDERMRDAAQSLTESPGEYTIDMHGDPNSVYVGEDQFNANELATILKQDPNWHGEKPIRLFACNTGKLSTGFGQQLANELDVDVRAPTQPAWSYEGGDSFVSSISYIDPLTNVAHPTLPPDGDWIVFRPQKSKEG